MLFKILKLFGLDVPARIAAARHGLERRVEDAAGQVKQAAAMAATLAVLYALAALSGLLACGVGLIALYRYVALSYGEFFGFAVDGGVLIILAAILFMAARATGKAWVQASEDANRMRRGRALADAAALQTERAAKAMAAAALVEQSRKETESRLAKVRQAQAQAVSSNIDHSNIHHSNIDHSNIDHLGLADAAPMRVDSARDLIEPLAFLLSRVLKFPSTGNPALDELVGHLRVAARETTDEAVEGAARTIRFGSRGTLVFVLGSATLLGWFLATRHSHPASGPASPGR